MIKLELTQEQAKAVWLYFDGLNAWLDDERPLDQMMLRCARNISQQMRQQGFDSDQSYHDINNIAEAGTPTSSPEAST